MPHPPSSTFLGVWVKFMDSGALVILPDWSFLVSSGPSCLVLLTRSMVLEHVSSFLTGPSSGPSCLVIWGSGPTEKGLGTRSMVCGGDGGQVHGPTLP